MKSKKKKNNLRKEEDMIQTDKTQKLVEQAQNELTEIYQRDIAKVHQQYIHFEIDESEMRLKLRNLKEEYDKNMKEGNY